MKGFLYGQSEYNILSSCNRLDEYVNKAIENNFDFLSITDKNMFGAYKFYNLCKLNNIKPVIGIEYNFNFGDNKNSKVLLYAKGNEGFKNLVKISSKVMIDNIDTLDDLKDYINDIYFIFVFNNSLIEELLVGKELNILNDLLKQIKSFDGYIGISNTNYPFKEDINKEIISYSYNYGIECIDIHRCNYLNKNDYKIYETLRLLDGEKEEILANDFSFINNPLNNKLIDKLVGNINLSIYDEKPKLPKFPNSKGLSSHDYLESLCLKGLNRRLKINHINNDEYSIYFERLKYELSIISKMGYEDYFLIVWDFIRYSKQNDILVGPGRGSAAGSLVAYSLGITEIDPIKYGLYFERFLNPERITMPDIDTDFPDDKRDKVIDYVRKIYGDYHVCQITTFGRFKLKSSIKDLARILKLDINRANKIVDMVEKYGFDYLLKEYENTDIELYDFLSTAKGLENLPRHISTHPAGVILSDVDLTDIVPLYSGINGLYQSQYEAPDLEKIGLLKMDFLAISNLTMIDGMMKDSNLDINDLRNIPLDDKNVYKMLSKGDTLGLFQLESIGIRKVLVELKPEKFSDLVAVIALYRPGPMDNIPEFIRRMHGGKFEYIHPDLKPILEETYGIIVYQEQIMQIARKFAGFSLGEADLLRRAISKKDASKLEAMKNKFIDNCINRNYSMNLAENIYDLIYKFADYGFNKSHSVVYALVAYQMAYFKVNYFPQFMGNILNNVISSSTLLSEYILYTKKHGLIVHKPNINISTNRFHITKEGLFIPFTAIKSIGSLVTNKILEARNIPFTSYDDFRNRTSFLTSEQVMALIFSGALDMFSKTKKSMCENTNSLDQAFLKHMNVKEEKDEYDFNYLSEMEKKYLGFNLEYNIFTNYDNLLKKYNLISLDKIPFSSKVGTIVKFKSFSKKNTKTKGENMAVGTIMNEKIEYRFVMFPKDYALLKININIDNLYIVNGILRYDNKKEKGFIVDEIFEIK